MTACNPSRLGRAAIRTPGRLPRPPALRRIYEASAGGASGRFGQVLYDQRGRLISIVVTGARA